MISRLDRVAIYGKDLCSQGMIMRLRALNRLGFDPLRRPCPLHEAGRRGYT